MPNKLELGITGSASCIVTEADTAKAVGSGGVSTSGASSSAEGGALSRPLPSVRIT